MARRKVKACIKLCTEKSKLCNLQAIAQKFILEEQGQKKALIPLNSAGSTVPFAVIPVPPAAAAMQVC